MAGKTFTKRASDDSVMIRGVSGGMEKGEQISEIFRKLEFPVRV